MANILIVDDNYEASALFKQSLQSQRHRIIRGMDVRDAIDTGGSAPDLVQINREFKNNTGWKTFNFLKQAAPDLPAMIYTLEQLATAHVAWIGRAIETVIPQFMRETAEVGISSERQTPL